MSEDLVLVISLACGVTGGLSGFVIGGILSVSRERKIYRRGKIDGAREATARRNPTGEFRGLSSLHQQYARRVK